MLIVSFSINAKNYIIPFNNFAVGKDGGYSSLVVNNTTIQLVIGEGGFNYNQHQPCPHVGEADVVGNTYKIDCSVFKLSSSFETEFKNGSSFTKTSDYYNTCTLGSNFFANTFFSKQHTENTKGKTQINGYGYTSTSANHLAPSLIATMLHYIPNLSSGIWEAGQTISKTKYLFSNFSLTHGSFSIISSIQSYKNTNDNYETDLVMDKYDGNGNILQYHKEDGTSNPFYTSFLWRTNLLLFKTDEAIWTDYQINTDFKSFKSNLTKKVTRYTYNPLLDLETKTRPHGVRETYIYDSNPQLEMIIDNNNKIIKKFECNIK